MRDDNGSWFDDPEWERLRHEINGRSFGMGSGRFRLFGRRKAQQPAPVAPPRQPGVAPAQQPVYRRPSQTPPKPLINQRQPGNAYPQAVRPPQYVRQQPLPRPQTPTSTAKDPKSVNVSINLTLPTIKVDKIKEHPSVQKAHMGINKLKSLSRRQLILGAAACLLLVGSFGAIKAMTRQGDDDISSGVLGQTAKEPEFDTVLPEGKKEEITSPEVAYDSERKVASFADVLNGVNITVSQQPLPENFKTDTETQVRKLAEGFNADMEIKAGGIRAYKGTNANGPQTVIFHRGELLVFILSEKEIPDDVWGTYILRLE